MTENKVSAEKNCYDLLITLAPIIKKIPREYKYSYWKDVERYLSTTLSHVSFAAEEYEHPKKIEHLHKAKQNLKLSIIYRHICYKIWAINSEEQFKKIKNEMTSIYREINKRYTSLINKITKQNNE